MAKKKIYIDHRINSIQNYMSPDLRHRYDMIDVNVYQENIFHTKMLIHDFKLDNYLFDTTEKELDKKEVRESTACSSRKCMKSSTAGICRL